MRHPKAMKALGLAASLIVSFLIGFLMGIDRTWDTASKFTALNLGHLIREAVGDGAPVIWVGPVRLEAVNRQRSYFKVIAPKDIAIAGIGDQGIRKVTE